MKAFSLTCALFVAAAALASCRHQGPVQAEEVPSPAGPVVVDPILKGRVGLPEGRQPKTTFTADGRMHFELHLQNRTDKDLTLRLYATFYDEAGIAVDPQGPITEHFQPYAIQTIPFTSSTSKAKKVNVQVRPAN